MPGAGRSFCRGRLTPPRRPLDRRGRPRRPRPHFRAGALRSSACGLRALDPRDPRPLRSLARLRAVQSPRRSRLPTPGPGDQALGPAVARPPATDTALRHPLTELSICPVSANLIWLLVADRGRQMTSAPRRLIPYGPWWPFSRWCLIKCGLRRIGGLGTGPAPGLVRWDGPGVVCWLFAVDCGRGVTRRVPAAR